MFGKEYLDGRNIERVYPCTYCEALVSLLFLSFFCRRVRSGQDAEQLEQALASIERNVIQKPPFQFVQTADVWSNADQRRRSGPCGCQ